MSDVCIQTFHGRGRIPEWMNTLFSLLVDFEMKMNKFECGVARGIFMWPVRAKVGFDVFQWISVFSKHMTNF